MKQENLKKEIVKAILFIILFIVLGTIAILLTDNRFVLILTGILISRISKLLDKFIDEED